MLCEGVATRAAAERAVLTVAGPDAEGFLQGLLTNDVARAAPDRLTYAALLTPQGKFLVDALIDRPRPDVFRLDVRGADADALRKRLAMYRLRAQVEIDAAPMGVVQAWRPDGGEMDASLGLVDPRSPALGRRAIVDDPSAVVAARIAEGAVAADQSAYDALRISARAPEAPLDLRAGEAFPLEYDFERLNGVDFRKGCYVGQEVTARMKHKATLKKRLVRVAVGPGDLAEDREVRLADGRPAGQLGTVAAGAGLALLRADRIGPGLVCGAAAIDPLDG